MTQVQNLLMFALPITANNAERCRRLGVILFTPDLDAALRLAIWTGTRAYDPNDPNAQAFQTRYSADGGDSATHYLGIGQLTNAQLLALAERLGDAAALNVKYAVIDANTYVLTPQYNVNAFGPFEGQIVSPGQLLAVAGLTQLKPSGGGLSIRPQ